MDYAWFLFSFEGRINRARYWFAILIILCWMIFLAALAVGVAVLLGHTGPFHFGFSIDDVFKIFDSASYRSLSWADLPVLVFDTAGSALLLWVYLATSVKRLHDRDKSGWWMVPFFVLPGLHVERILDDSIFVMLLALAAFIFCIWGFIELYFRKGSRKTNRFGPDPLAPRDTRRPWDQQSEIEMVPHKANAHFPKFAFPRGDYLSRTSESNGH
jgi:uncharacterized membrane protein YhaH (DUF805 family)